MINICAIHVIFPEVPELAFFKDPDSEFYAHFAQCLYLAGISYLMQSRASALVLKTIITQIITSIAPTTTVSFTSVLMTKCHMGFTPSSTPSSINGAPLASMDSKVPEGSYLEKPYSDQGKRLIIRISHSGRSDNFLSNRYRPSSIPDPPASVQGYIYIPRSIRVLRVCNG